MAEYLELLVEEPSMETALRALLPKIVGTLAFQIVTHQCKNELLLRLPQRLDGYRRRRENDPWFRAHSRVVILVDRDDDDCTALKQRLEAAARHSGLMSRSGAAGGNYFVANRLAIEELEAWYFGDPEALSSAYPGVPVSLGKKAKFRDPDHLQFPALELEKLTGKRYQKVAGSRAIAPHLDLERPGSRSFRHLIRAIRNTTARLGAS